MGNIHELRTKRATLVKKANDALEAAQAKAAEEGRELSAEELAAQDEFDVQLAAFDSQIKAEERKNERLAKLGSSAQAGEGEQPREPVPGSGPQADVRFGRNRAEDDPRRGFASHKEFLLAAMKNARRREIADVDERLRPLAVRDDDDDYAGSELAFMLPVAFTPRSLRAAAGSDEQGTHDAQYGGFAVAPALLPGMLQIGAEADPTAGRTQPVPMTAPMIEMLARVDKNHSTSVSGGFVVTRKPETAEAQSSRGKIAKVTLRASSLFGLAFATEEVLTDSPISFTAIIATGFDEQFAFQMLNEKLRGNGGDEFLGVLNSPAKVSVAKENGQLADTILAENVINMRSRCWGYSNAIWIANHDTLPQLIKLAVVVSDGAGAGGLVLIYKASSQEDRPDMLLGRPIFYHEQASKLGDEGDLILCNWSQYLEGLYQPLQSAESVHVRFVNHERTFKFWLRNAGAPWWQSALTPHKSAQTLSPIVTLADRA